LPVAPIQNIHQGSKLYKKYFITLVLEHGITKMKSGSR